MVANKLSVSRGVLAAGSFLAVLGLSTTGWSQPNPFDDYEKWKREDAAPAESPAPKTESPESSEEELVFSLKKGTLTLGGRGMFSYTGTSNEVLSGSDESNTTLFYRLAPAVGYSIRDDVQLGGSIGLLESP